MVSLTTEHIDIWTTAQTQKNNGGRGRGNGSANQSLHGIKKLRELILELAVRGKLVPQNPDDEPASVLLEKIAKEKKRLIKEGKIKKQKPLPEIGENEKSYKVAEMWEWVRFGECIELISGQHLKPHEYNEESSGIPYLTGPAEFGNPIPMPTRWTHFKKAVAQNGDIILTVKGAGVGKINIVDSLELAISRQLMAIRPFIADKHYVYLYLKSISEEFQSKQTGIAIPGIGRDDVNNNLFPLPPLAEQHLIVAKVDELMALCDQLEQQQTESNTAHQTLVETLLATLNGAADQDEFVEAWQRLAKHFDTLFTTDYSIEQLKQTILQIAVMGKLVPQDPNSEPASVLLEKIAKEKNRLIKEGKIKKQNPLPEITESETPFELPGGWEWTQLGNLSANIHYGYTASADHGISGIRLLRITDIQNDSVNWETVPGCEIDGNKAKDYLLENDDILIARTGGTIGKSYLVENIDTDAVFASYLIRVKRIVGMYSPFIKTYLGSQLYWQQLYENSMGTGQPNVNATALKGLLFPLPPLSEQQRIVAKVDELMELCDMLKVHLKDAQTTQIQLADAVVEQAVA